MPELDVELFDPSQFQAELALKASPIPAFKKAIRHAREALDARFLAGSGIRGLIEQRAWFVDQILRAAWERFDWDRNADIALVAVGGYGRGELHPYSDIDLLVLLDNNDQEIFREPIEGFLTLLWDIGLEVGQAVRSVAECADEARADLTVITNLMEAGQSPARSACARRCCGSPVPNRCGLARNSSSPSATSRRRATPSSTTPNTTWSPT